MAHIGMYRCVDFREAEGQTNDDISKTEIVGKRVRFLSTNDPYPTLRFNDLGTVADVIKLPNLLGGQFQLRIRWDNGSKIPLVYGIDSFDIFTGAGI